MARRVLITRPEPGASATAQWLLARGLEPVLLPLTRIEPLPMTPMPNAAAFDAVAVTSANAIRHTPPKLLAALAGKPLLVVGEQTARAAVEAGLGPVAALAPDAERLVAATKLDEGTRVLYLAGRQRGSRLEDGLREQGHRLEVVEVYDAPEIEIRAREAGDILGKPVDDALVHSPRAGVLLAALVERQAYRAAFAETRFLAISARAAEPFLGRFAERTHIAATPDEEGVLALLDVAG